jgi:hypothetical protein
MADTFWSADFWPAGFWADGFWTNAGAPEPPDPTPTPSPAPADTTGGWAAFFRYEQERERRRRRRRELEEAEEARERIDDPVTQEIAEILQRQEREDARRIELERLRVLASEFRESAMLPAKVNDAIRRAQERQTVAALMNLDRELRRMLEEEEAAIVMLLVQDLQ